MHRRRLTRKRTNERTNGGKKKQTSIFVPSAQERVERVNGGRGGVGCGALMPERVHCWTRRSSARA